MNPGIFRGFWGIGLGGEGGAEEGAEFIAQFSEACCVWSPSDGSQHLGFGGYTGQRGVAERRYQLRIGSTDPTSVHTNIVWSLNSSSAG